MRGLRAFSQRLLGMMDRGRRDRQFAEEIETHLAMQVEENMASGMSAEEARRVAIVQHGGLEQAKQVYRERNTVPVLENLARDLRFSLRRQLGNNLGFTTTAVLMLALGMGASVAIFAFVDAALIKPLPFAAPKRIVSVFETVIREQLFGVAAWDAGTLAAVAGVLGAAAMLASYLPARRAASINPVEALRAE